MTKTKGTKKALSSVESKELLNTLKTRFEKHMIRHKGLEWPPIQAKLASDPKKMWTLHEMEASGGEPDVVAYDANADEFVFFDCSPESPAGRRSVCFDQEALDSRKENKPADSAMEIAASMGIELLSEQQYRELQRLGKFDMKTSSWIQTPADIRKLGGALFADFRYDTVFIYHNGASSYYAARGFRGAVRV